MTELDDKAERNLASSLGIICGACCGRGRHYGCWREEVEHQRFGLILRKLRCSWPISWRRPPTANTTASFTYWLADESGRKVEDLVIKGQNLSIKGDGFLNATGGMKSAKLSQVWLSEKGNFTHDNGTDAIASRCDQREKPLMRVRS